MKDSQLNILMDELTQPLFGFSYALCPDRDKATQLLVDAFTVFLVRERRFLVKKKLDRSPSERRQFKRYLYKELLGEILELAKKRLYDVNFTAHDQEEYVNFYKLDLLKRGVLYLKEVRGFTIQDIQEILGIERHRALECFYNARHEMVADIENLFKDEGVLHELN